MKKSLLIVTLLSLPFSFNLHAGSDTEVDEVLKKSFSKLKITPKNVRKKKNVNPNICPIEKKVCTPRRFVPTTPRKDIISKEKLARLIKTGRFEMRDGRLWKIPLEAPIPVKNQDL